jgi:hypothetical protein
MFLLPGMLFSLHVLAQRRSQKAAPYHVLMSKGRPSVPCALSPRCTMRRTMVMRSLRFRLRPMIPYVRVEFNTLSTLFAEYTCQRRRRQYSPDRLSRKANIESPVHRMASNPKCVSKGSKSRSLCRREKPLWMTNVAIRQSTVLRTVIPRRRKARKFCALWIAISVPPRSKTRNWSSARCTASKSRRWR